AELLVRHAFRVFWMKQRVHISALPLLQGETVKFERGPVHIETTAIRPKLRDVQRREVEDVTKLSLALTDLLFRPPLIVDVRVQPVPSEYATSFVAQGIDVDVDPAIDAVEAHQPLHNVH